MQYPFPDLVPHLQFPCSPDAYQAHILRHYNLHQPGVKLTDHKHAPASEDPWWSCIPTYTYAVCPFCSHRFMDAINTNSLYGWPGVASGKLGRLPYRTPGTAVVYDPVCVHYAGVHVFLNMHDHPPPFSYFTSWTTEVPYITPWLVPADIPSAAVFWATPICDVIDGIFVPTSTMFILTYFSDDMPTIVRRYMTQEVALYGHDPAYYPTLLAGPHERPAPDQPDLYDLAAWADRRVLFWLEGSGAEPVLRTSGATPFPAMFQHIQGDRNGFSYRRGRKQR